MDKGLMDQFKREIKHKGFLFVFLIVLFAALFFTLRRNESASLWAAIGMVVLFSGIVYLYLDIDDLQKLIKDHELKNTDYSKGDPESGKISIIADRIVLGSNNNTIDFLISDVKIIGELTNGNGPYADDWFVFFIIDETKWFQVSMYAENVHGALKGLSQILKAEIIGSLFYSTDWKTNVIYPEKLKGKELFLTEGSWRNKRIILNPELKESLK